MNDTPVAGLREGGFLNIDNGTIDLLAEQVRIFRKGEEPLDVDPGGDCSILMET